MPPSLDKKKPSSPDYPSLVRQFLEASGDKVISKLPAGLYVVATPIGHLGDITLRGLITLASADLVACEDTRVSGGLLAKYGLKKPLLAYHDHNTAQAGAKILDTLLHGHAVALISDAGLPLISDPGYPLVRDCRKAGLTVTVIPGANAALTALAGSGLPTDEFHFYGFLPPKSSARRNRLTALSHLSGTLVFYEAPQRLAASLNDMAMTLGATRAAVVARELTKLFEETKSGSLAELSTFYQQHIPKGEMVIMIGPPDPAEPQEISNLDQLLVDALREQSLRDAALYVSHQTGIKKSLVYARALELSQKPDQD